MVVFCCDGCGSVLKKNQVDTHVYRCRDGCPSVSCVDCSVSFFGDDFSAHTSCISEAERYEKTVYKGNKKKKNPQEAWMEIMADAASTAPPSIQSQIQELAAFDNVPRKEKQFRNYVANSLFLKPEAVAQIWTHLASTRELAKKESEKKEQEEVTAKKLIADEKAKAVSETATQTKETTQDMTDAPMPSTKIMTKAIKKSLKKAPNGTLKLKALRKLMTTKLAIRKHQEKEFKTAMMECLQNQKEKAGEKKNVTLQGKDVCLS